MYFNLLLILFYFNIVNSIPDSDELYDIYENDLRTIENSESISEQSSENSFYSMLNLENPIDLFKWSTLCQQVIQHMRKESDKYKYIYVNYIAFKLNENKEKCPTVDVWVPRMNKKVQQRACHCFGRSATFSLHNMEEYSRYFWKLSFYASIRKNEIMVFEYDDNNNYYILVDILKEISYNSKRFYHLVANNPRVFTTAVPMSFIQKDDLRQKLETFLQNVNPNEKSNNNIIYFLSVSKFKKLCEAILNKQMYENDVIIDIKRGYKERPTQEPTRAIFEVPYVQNVVFNQIGLPHVQENKEYNVYLPRICPGYDPRILRRIKTFKITAGPENHSLIVLKETELVNRVTNQPLHEIIELVENVTLDYVELYMSNLY